MNIFAQVVDWNLDRLAEAKEIFKNRQWGRIGLEHLLPLSLLLLIIFIASHLVNRIFESLIKVGVIILVIWTIYLLLFNRSVFYNLSQSFSKPSWEKQVEKAIKDEDFKDYKEAFLGSDEEIMARDEEIAEWKISNIPATKAREAYENGWNYKEVKVRSDNGNLKSTLNGRSYKPEEEIRPKENK